MMIKLVFAIEIDEADYPGLTQPEIRRLVKEATEANGSITDYIREEAAALDN